MNYLDNIRRFPFLVLLLCSGCMQAKSDKEIWHIDNIETIGHHKVTVLGKPEVVTGSHGQRCLSFDGKQDALLVHYNPIAGAKGFSIRVIFKSYSSYPNNIAQRFLHIQDPQNKDHRILIELRLNNNHQWYGDLFMSTSSDSMKLSDPSKVHSVNQWDTIELSYNHGIMKGYVNGIAESSGKVDFTPFGKSANISIGMRMNRISWFHGEIAKVIFNRSDAIRP